MSLSVNARNFIPVFYPLSFPQSQGKKYFNSIMQMRLLTLPVRLLFLPVLHEMSYITCSIIYMQSIFIMDAYKVVFSFFSFFFIVDLYISLMLHVYLFFFLLSSFPLFHRNVWRSNSPVSIRPSRSLRYRYESYLDFFARLQSLCLN